MWWLDEPYAFVLWTYFQMQEEDRRNQWVARYHRWEQAYYVAKGFNEPESLTGAERRSIMAEAARHAEIPDDAELRTRGARLVRDIIDGKVLLS